MQILMLQTRYGSEDGFVVRQFSQNNQYEVADSLGTYFIRIGAAQFYCCHPALITGSGQIQPTKIIVPEPATSAG